MRYQPDGADRWCKGCLIVADIPHKSTTVQSVRDNVAVSFVDCNDLKDARNIVEGGRDDIFNLARDGRDDSFSVGTFSEST